MTGINRLHVCLNREFGKKWVHVKKRDLEVWVKGFGFKERLLFTGMDFAEIFIKSVKPKEKARRRLTDTINDINGNFAVIVNGDGFLFAGVDRLRSIPLFYGRKGHDFFVGDDAEWVRAEVCDTEIDEIASVELMLTGYVTGQETLFPNVKGLQAGEYLWIQHIYHDFKIDTSRYYCNIRKDYFDSEEHEIYPLMDQMLTNVFQRLIDSNKDRTLVVPLSGGFDSRLIVAMLKKMGARKVVCFSYGKAANWESEISRKVAAKLGYRWEYVTYNEQRWLQDFLSAERREYFEYGADLTSVPVLTNWPAVKELKNKKLVPEDSIFIPGHTGDFISGGHIPATFLNMKKITEDDIADAILRRHYCLWDWSREIHRLDSILRDRIVDQIGKNYADCTQEDAVGAFQRWEWQERQAKFIVNSVKVYDFWGYDWRMPLWDNEVMQFFSKVPLELCFKQKLYIDYLFTKIFPEYDIAFTPPRYSLFLRARNKLYRMLGKYNSIMLFESMYKLVDMSNSRFIDPANINSYFGLLLLDNIKESLKKESLIRV